MKSQEQIKAQTILGGDPQDERQKRRLIPTLRTFVEDQYLPFVQTYKRSWRTDETVLRIHVLPHLGRLYLDEVTTASITELVTSMRGDDYAPGTVARVIVILRFLFNLARKWKVLKDHDNPAADIPVAPDVQRNRFLDKIEIGRLVEVLRKDENQIAAKAICSSC